MTKQDLIDNGYKKAKGKYVYAFIDYDVYEKNGRYLAANDSNIKEIYHDGGNQFRANPSPFLKQIKL